MDTFTKVLSIFAIVMSIAGGAAFIWAFSIASFNKNQLEGLREARDDLAQRVAFLERDREELKAGALIKDAAVADANAKITVLEGIVTHDAAINGLIKTVQAHDSNVEKHYTDYMSIISQVLQSNEHVLEKLDITLQMIREGR